MATTLGGTTLASGIFECAESEPATAYQRRMADGSLRTTHGDVVKRSWRVAWRALLAADVATIRAEYEDTAGQLWSPPDIAGTYTVMAARGSWDEKTLMSGATTRYDVTFEIEEV